MTLTEGFLKDAVFIDFGAEMILGSDQVYVSYPHRFPTVIFHLITTGSLSAIADRIRLAQGLKPMYPVDGFLEDGCDQEGWYSFRIGINGYAPSHVDSCIEFTVENSESPDNGYSYSIDLTFDEQTAVFNRLNEQCRSYLEKDCMDLLDEAEELL